jgi:hypothetical protein
MPIATAISIILIMVYIVMRAVSRTGELLLKTMVRGRPEKNLNRRPCEAPARGVSRRR